MGLCVASDFSIFTFSSASNLKGSNCKALKNDDIKLEY